MNEGYVKYLSFHRPSHRFRGVADGQAVLRIRLRDLAYARESYGYRRLHMLIQKEGWKVNHKRGLKAPKAKGPRDAVQET